jgi:pilus assembly protein FimV
MDGMDMGLLAPAGGLLALLGGGWMYLRKKREKSLADFEQGIMTSGGLKANTVFGNTASASVDTGDTSFLTDFSQSANGGMIDTNDVDPIAEAEVYMAYGRDAQAEEILKDAISKEPKRYELHLKLLEMYAASKNTSAFETIAGELYTTLGAEDPTWSKVSEIGIKLEPSNPLYQAGNSPTGGTAGAGLDANDFSNSPLAAEKDLDFTFDNDALTKGFAPTGTFKTEEIDLNLGKVEEPKTLEASFEAPVEEAASESDLVFEMDAKPETVVEVEDNTSAMEFDMGSLGDFESTAPVESIKTAAEEFGHTMPSLDIPTFSAPNFMPETTEVADEITPPDTLDVDTFQFDIEEAAQSEGVLDISGMEAEIVKFDMLDEVANTQTDGLDAASFSDASFTEANTFDLTTIDLDLNEAAKLDSVEANVEDAAVELNVAGNEPIEVDTKLDLVAAYIEMDDKEGAKELLAEVMKEGGAGQRKRAEALQEKLA